MGEGQGVRSQAPAEPGGWVMSADIIDFPKRQRGRLGSKARQDRLRRAMLERQFSKAMWGTDTPSRLVTTDDELDELFYGSEGPPTIH